MRDQIGTSPVPRLSQPELTHPKDVLMKRVLLSFLCSQCGSMFHAPLSCTQFYGYYILQKPPLSATDVGLWHPPRSEPLCPRAASAPQRRPHERRSTSCETGRPVRLQRDPVLNGFDRGRPIEDVSNVVMEACDCAGCQPAWAHEHEPCTATAAVARSTIDLFGPK